MQVETFECHEVAEETIEETEEAVKIINDLGIYGQKNLVYDSYQEGVNKKRVPYRQINADERFVYKMLCPKDYPLEEYNRSSIPLRVLQVLEHARGLCFFDNFVIWDRDEAQVKDPVLIGLGGSSNTWDRKEYIIARWGDELETFSILLKRAINQKREQMIHAAKSVVMRSEHIVREAESLSSEQLIKLGQDLGPNIYIPWK